MRMSSLILHVGWILAALTTLLFLEGCGNSSARWSAPWCRHVGSGPKKTLQINVLASFSKVNINSGISAYLTVGSAASFEVSIYENVADGLQVQVSGDTLHISMKLHYCYHGASAKLQMTMAPRGLTVNGGSPVSVDILNGNLVVDGGSPVTVRHVAASDFELSNNGGSPVTIHQVACTRSKLGSNGGSPITVHNVTCEELGVTNNGGSPVTVKHGSVRSCSVSNNGGSRVMLGSLTATSGQISLHGGASLQGMTAKDMDLHMSGGAHIDTTVSGRVSGSCNGGGFATIRGGGSVSSLKTGGGCGKRAEL